MFSVRAGTVARLRHLRAACAPLLLLAACTGAPSFAEAPSHTSWVGRTQQELLAARGEPETVRIRPDGSLLLEYLARRGGLTCRSVYLSDFLGRIAAEKEQCE
jgi:hypothetical protein